MRLSEADRQELLAAASGSGARLLAPVGGSVVPVPLTSFVGRQELIVLGTRLMAQERLITLTGLGGVGKTRLAVELSRSTAETFAGGRWTVDVESLAEATSVTESAAAVLGLRDPPDADHIDSLARSIGRLRCLLTLDGCERRTTECAAVARRLLGACPGLVVLVTSQRPLGVQGEVILAAPPLVVPVLGEENATETEAVRLFRVRARLAAPGLELRDDELGAVAQLCRRLDGIPLAIELAAARIHMLPVPEMLVRMEDRFDLLRGEGDLPARKRAIRTALEWSCALLTTEERELFGRLSVFVGGFSLPAAEAGPGRGLSQVMHLMTTLVSASLVAPDSSHGLTGRFRLLDTVRAYASELLESTHEEDAVRLAHADYYLALAEIGEHALRGGDQAQVLRLLDEEYENVRAALHYWAASPEPGFLLRLVTALAPYWVRRGRSHEGQYWLRQIFASNPLNTIPLRAFEAASDLCWISGDVSTHREAARRYLHQATRAGDVTHQARATSYVASTYLAEGDMQTWQALVDRAAELAAEVGDAWTLAIILNDTCNGTVLSDAAVGRGKPDPSVLAQLRDAVGLARSTGDVNLVAIVLDSLAYAEARSGLIGDALTHWSECLTELGDVIDPAASAACIEGLAQLAHLDGRPADCLTLLGAGTAYRRRHGVTSSPIWATVMSSTAAAARAVLPAATITRAEGAGERLTFAEAAQLGLRLSDNGASEAAAAPRVTDRP